MLREKSLAKKEAERAKKAEEDARAAAAEEAKKAAGEGQAAAETTTTKVEPAKISVLIKEQGTKILNDFVKNEVFLKQVSDANGDEIQLLAKFKELAREIIDESCSAIFNCAKTQNLMDKLTEYLT